MSTPETPDLPEPPDTAELRRTKRNLRRALIFGVVMATIQMGALLYFMYC